MVTERQLIDLNDVFPNKTFTLVTGDPWKTLDKLINRLTNAPVIDAVEVVHGRWLINPDGYYPYCSECKEEPKGGGMTNYCPNCGAKMDGDKNGN